MTYQLIYSPDDHACDGRGWYWECWDISGKWYQSQQMFRTRHEAEWARAEGVLVMLPD